MNRKLKERKESRIIPGFLALSGLGYVRKAGEEADFGGGKSRFVVWSY